MDSYGDNNKTLQTRHIVLLQNTNNIWAHLSTLKWPFCIIPSDFSDWMCALCHIKYGSLLLVW